MPAEYLDCEIDEMVVEQCRLDEAEFNAWFDNSEIKARHKKACMQAQVFRCCYCHRFKETMDGNEWDLEHVLSERDYPQFFAEPLNLTVACKRCNRAKGHEDVLRAAEPRPPIAVPDQAKSYTIPHPHLTTWNDHLRHTSHMIYEGLTDEGWELVRCCELNGKAEEAAGVNPGAVRTAKENHYFARFGAKLPEGIDLDHQLAVFDAGAEQRDEMLAERMMKRVERDLAKRRAAAERRAAYAAEALF